MKKLRDWIKNMPERQVFWMMQAMSVLTFVAMLYSAIVVTSSAISIFDAVAAGLCAGNFVHNVLHRRRNHALDEMMNIAEQQQAMLNEMGQIKSREIAAEIASQMRGEVAPVAVPSPPTKH